MACCMFAALIAGHIVLVWRRISAWWSPACAAAQAADRGAAAWRPGLETAATVLLTAPASRPIRRRLLAKPVGIMLIAVSLSYFTVQAMDALKQTSDARSFAMLLAQNICRIPRVANTPPPLTVATATQPSLSSVTTAR